MKAGVNFISYAKDNPQLKALKERINTLDPKVVLPSLICYFKLQGGNIPENDLETLKTDITYQFYKFYNALPGKLIKLDSQLSFRWGITLFAVRNEKGEFSILMKRPLSGTPFFEFDKLPFIKQWTPSQGLNIHLSFLAKHLESQNVNITYYVGAIAAQSDALNALPENEILTLPAEPSQHRKCPVHILKTSAAEFIILFETGDVKEPYLQFNVEEKVIWKKYQGFFLPQKAIDLLERLKEARLNVISNGVSRDLATYIQKEDLINIYQFLLSDIAFLKKLAHGEPFRIAKGEGNTLTRTLNIVIHRKGEYMLMLETKCKLANGFKDKSLVISESEKVKVKPAWRIDGLSPDRWVNKRNNGHKILSAEYAAFFSQHTIPTSENAEHSLMPCYTVLGAYYLSKLIKRRSEYSKRAIGNLTEVLKRILLAQKDKDRIALCLLEQMAMIHGQKKIHQDLKSENVFIYQDEDGYYAKIADFENAYDSSQPPKCSDALSTSWNASPELLIAYEAPGTVWHDYFFKDKTVPTYCYAYQKCIQHPAHVASPKLAEIYSVPHPANDMWALGTILFHLSIGPSRSVTDEGLKRASSLIQGLLEVDRDIRLTAPQALQLFKRDLSLRPSTRLIQNAMREP